MLGLREEPRPKAMPLLSGRAALFSYGELSFLPKLLRLKELGRKEKRREFRLFSEGVSESFLLKPKLVRRELSVDCRGVASSLVGMGWRMLTGGYLRSRFSSTLGWSCCCDARREREELRPKMRSPMLPRVLERLWPR